MPRARGSASRTCCASPPASRSTRRISPPICEAGTWRLDARRASRAGIPQIGGMPHSTPLITTLVAALTAALLLGVVARKLRLPPLVGYLVAGVLIGPHTPGFIGNLELAGGLSEIGIILLMFGVGLHFSPQELVQVRGVAVPGALTGVTVVTLLGWGLARLLGWTNGQGLVFGICLSVASTVVVLRSLQERGETTTRGGHVAIGWLVVEDLAMVLALVLVPVAAALLDG